jgi:hypothetical protein
VGKLGMQARFFGGFAAPLRVLALVDIGGRG